MTRSPDMLTQIILEAWIALKRNLTRSFLTMLGIVWGIATVTLLIAYGNSFRSVLVNGFNAFGKSVVIGWPGQTGQTSAAALSALHHRRWRTASSPLRRDLGECSQTSLGRPPRTLHA